MKVIIQSESLRRETTTKGNEIFKQQAALDAGDGSFPLPFMLTVLTPYKVGEYRLAGSSFRQSRFGGLEIDAYGVELVPVAEQARKAS